MSSGTVINSIKEKMDTMLGNSYEYGSGIHHVLKYKIDPDRDRVYITTDQNIYDRTFDAFFEFIALFKAVQLPDVHEQKRGIIVRQVSDNDLVSLRDILMDNIQKIKTDKSYISQAEAIKGNVDSIINLAKTDIAYMTFFKSTKK